MTDFARVPSVPLVRHVFGDSLNRRHCAPYCVRIGKRLEKTQWEWKSHLWAWNLDERSASDGSKRSGAISEAENHDGQSTDNASERIAVRIRKLFLNRDSRSQLLSGAWRSAV